MNNAPAVEASTGHAPSEQALKPRDSRAIRMRRSSPVTTSRYLTMKPMIWTSWWGKPLEAYDVQGLRRGGQHERGHEPQGGLGDQCPGPQQAGLGETQRPDVDARAGGDERHQQGEAEDGHLDQHPCGDVAHRHARGGHGDDHEQEVDAEGPEALTRREHDHQDESQDREDLEVGGKSVDSRVPVVVEVVAVAGTHLSLRRRRAATARCRGAAAA